jgi:hypothetical protein
MSDTRAAIRELRTLSEKRSLGALSEAEAARWLALRRQLGLPLEPANAPVLSAPVAEASHAVTGSEAAATAASQVEAAPAETAWTHHEAEGPAPASEALPAAHGTPAESWAGPSLVAPTAASATSWGGPSLDAPAWSDAVAERPTDPGLDEPPPVPFDEAPAASRPPETTEVTDFGGSPDERVPLAAAAEFVSYARVGEAIDLPAETGDSRDLEPQSLAQLAAAEPAAAPAQPTEAAEAAAAAATLAVSEVPSLEAEDGRALVAELQGEEGSGVYEGVLPEAPLEPASPEALGADAGLPPPVDMPLPEGLGVFEGVLPEAPLELASPEALGADAGLPPPVEMPLPEGLGVFEGVLLAEAAPHSPAASPEAALDEGALPEAPYGVGAVPDEAMGVFPEPPLELLATLPEGDENVLAQAPLQLLAALDEVPADSGSSPPPEPLPEAPPPPLSTWAPGAAEPPVLATDDFARTGDPLGERGLDPWPEALPTEVSAEDVVETIGDEDVVEEFSTPTPLPAFPSVTPPGSGGIRGFQFPKPPPGPAPTPPTPPDWQRTQPGEPPFSRGAVPVAAVAPAAVAPGTPPPAPPRPPPSVVLPVPPPPPSRVTPPPVALRTPAPTPAPKPIAASAVALGTPRPTPGPGAQVPRPVTPVPGRYETLLAPPAPAPAGTPVLMPQPEVAEESALPLLDLVDEVEPPRPAPRAPLQPTPSPAQATGAVFGPPMMLNPSFVEGDHRVVIHTLEGQVHRGTVHDLDLQEEALAVHQPDGRSVEIPTRRLKAVFFVLSPGEKPLPGRGERVQVTFRDGRQVVGYSDDHATGEPGFFVVPSDARTNTARVYVFRGGVQSITTG